MRPCRGDCPRAITAIQHPRLAIFVLLLAEHIPRHALVGRHIRGILVDVQAASISCARAAAPSGVCGWSAFLRYQVARDIPSASHGRWRERLRVSNCGRGSAQTRRAVLTEVFSRVANAAAEMVRRVGSCAVILDLLHNGEMATCAALR